MSDSTKDYASGPTHRPTYLSLCNKNPSDIKEFVISRDPSFWQLYSYDAECARFGYSFVAHLFIFFKKNQNDEAEME